MKKLVQILLTASLGLSVFAGATASVDAQEKQLNLVTNAEPPTIDPGLSTDTTSGSIIDNVFENLTNIDQNNEVVPGAAESWDVSEDGTVYTFHIRENAVWSNGDPVTAQDFEFAWKRVLNPETLSQRANLYYVIKGAEDYNVNGGSVDEVGIKALDDKTFEVTLNSPVAYFLELINHYSFAPVNQKVVEADDQWASEAGEDYVTNGAFILSEWNHNSDYTLVRNDQYWDKDNVALDQVNVQIVESEATASNMFQNGDIDFLGAPYGAISLDNIEVFEQYETMTAEPYAGIYWYKVNTTDPVMQNANIRKALALGFSRADLVANITKGYHQPATGLVPPTITGFEEDRGYFTDGDVEQAKAFLQAGLEELGMSDPAELTINLSINTSEAHATIAQFVQEQWAQNLGINAVIDNTEWQVYLDKIQMLDYQVARLGWAADYNDAASFLGMYTTVDTGNNDTGWESPEYQDLMKQAGEELDAGKRTELLKEAEAVMMADMPVIPVYYMESMFVHQDKVQNMQPDAIGRYNLKYVDIAE